MAHAARAPRSAALTGSAEHKGEASWLQRSVDGVERRWAWSLALLMAVDAALLLYMGRGLSFFFDDWDYVTHDYGGGLHSLLLAHNGHMSLFPVAIYKILFHLVGLDHYAVFRIVLIALHLVCAGLVFMLASRRLARLPALLVTALILFLGVAWEDLLWAFQISYLLSVAGGLAAWVLLERRDRLGDVAATVAVIVSLGSSGLGIPILVGVVVELLWRREWRRWFIVVIPAVLYLLWYLHYGEDQLTRDGLINSPGFAEDIAAAAFGGIAGRGLEWGRPLAALLFAGLLVRTARVPAVSARLVGLLAAAVALWALTAAARSTISNPETGRYVYLGAVLILLIGVELTQGIGFGARAVGLGALVVALCVLAGLTTLHNGALALRGDSSTVTAELGALELAASHAPPEYQPDPRLAPQILAGPYLHTVRSIGSSPADTPAELTTAPPTAREAADGVLVALYAPTPVADARIGLSALAPAPVVTALSGATQLQHGACVLLAAPRGATTTVALTLPPGGVAIYDRGSSLVAAALRRFGEAFHAIGGGVAPHSDAVLTIPADKSEVAWQAQLSSVSPLTVCGLRA
jgi:hypothetical protein